MSFRAGLSKFGRLIHQRFSLLGWIALGLVFVAPLAAERLPVKTYTVADGLLRDNVLKIRQDSRGFLWFCTAEGISRFDGYAFTNFTIADGLPDRYVNDFLETKNGTIYIATNKGLARLNPTGLRSRLEGEQSSQNPKPENRESNNTLFSVYLSDNERAKEFHVLFEDESGAIWAGTSDGLYKLIDADGDAKLEAVNLDAPLENTGGLLSVNTIIQDRSGAMWVGTRASGLFRLTKNGVVRRFTIADGLPLTDIISLYQTKDGGLWAGFRGTLESAGLCLLDAETSGGGSLVKKCYSPKDGLSSSWVSDLYQTGDGQFWLATTNGLCRWQGDGQNSVCKTYTAKNELCDQDVWSVLEDKDGNLWTGSRCGAKKIARYGFTNYTIADGLAVSGVNSVFENQSGDLFASVNLGSRRIISRFDGEKFLTVNPRLPPDVTYAGWGWKQTVWQDHLGAWWIPTGNGLFRSPNATSFDSLAQAAFQRLAIEMKSSQIFRLFEDSRGDIWIATTGSATELFRWERATDVWHDYTQELGFSASRLGSAFAEDRDGTVWIGTGEADSALIRYRNGEFKVFGREDGIPAGWIRDLFFDHAGNLWIANIDAGLLKVIDKSAEKLSFIRYSIAEGMSSVGVYCITEDNFGRIYAGTGRGLDRLNPQTGQIENFTTFDGLLGSYVEICYRDRNGFLWFGTPNGLARFQPEPERQRRPPTILITGVRVSGEPQSVSIPGEKEIPEIELNAEQRQVSVDFLGLGANLGERLKYEYRLSGGDWTPTIERTVNFANLASGAYRFEIRAETADGVYSQSPAVLTFRIAAPLWQKWWFIAAVFLAVSVFIFLLYRYRVSRLLEVANMRARIATDLHDDIGANLTKISLLSEVVNLQLANQSVESSRLLNSIAEISRESVSSMSDIVWAINPKRDSALDLARRMRLHLEESFLDKNVRVRFNAPAAEDGASIKLSMDARRELYLIFKEAVSNAARYSDCRNVEVDFRLENNLIFLRIADDGKGFDASRKTDGNGLENMRSRAAKNGGKFEIASSAEYGTILEIRFPQN